MPVCHFKSADAKLNQDPVTKVRWVSLHVVALTTHAPHKGTMHPGQIQYIRMKLVQPSVLLEQEMWLLNIKLSFLPHAVEFWSLEM